MQTATKKGLKNGETRATVIVQEHLLNDLRKIAYWDRLKIKEIFNEAITDRITKYTKEHGSIAPIPN